MQKVVEQLAATDVQQLESAYVLKEAPELTRQALFTHPSDEVRGPRQQFGPPSEPTTTTPPADPDWLNAMKSYTVTENSRHNHIHTQALNALANASPAVFIEVFTQQATTTKLSRYRDLDEWKEPVQLLTRAERNKLWQQVRDTELHCHPLMCDWKGVVSTDYPYC